MYLSRTITEYTTTEVGLEFGGRDHTTVMYACQKIEERIKTVVAAEFPEVTIVKIQFDNDRDKNIIKFSLFYTITPFGIDDELTIEIQ